MGRSRGWRKTLAITGGILAILGVISLGTAWFLYQEYVVDNPGAHLQREDILRRISMESPVFYRDGVHKIGVFFGDEHRQYVKYAEIPQDFIHAIVASEDRSFFDHHGIDPRGIARALISNLKAGRVVAGGSTITQQTAKNLYYRPDRSWASKAEELLNALRLEQHYKKTEILEFYVNQFHVHANGRGLGIAARYFFDKDVKDLSTLECAFLAGVVKGPNRYNPFVGNSEEARARARERARIRTQYVLDRLEARGYLRADKAAALRKEELKFKQGDFRYKQNVILDYVFNQLQDERFSKLLAEHGIDNPTTAGIQIFTTVDREYQQAAEYGLRHSLSDVGAALEGLTLDAFLGPPELPPPLERDDVRPYGFFEGTVTSTYLTGEGAPGLVVDMGGIDGRVDREGLRRVAELLKQAQGQSVWSKASDKDVRALVDRFPVGRSVWVSVRRMAGTTPLLDLEAHTTLQGALVILENGRIRAMVGGRDNRNFNRVTQARRQLGSTLKPLTYAAALSLGWGTLSPLDNRRQGFLFQNQWYWPRADHEGVTPYLSMAFAGATSENVATVSLLYHLTDVLSEDQLLDLTARVGMTPQVGESTEDYIKRIRDRMGIIPTEASLAEGVFEAMKREQKVELAFSGRTWEATELAYTPYGNGFEAEAARTSRYVGWAVERQARLRFLARGFRQLEGLAPKALEAAAVLLEGEGSGAREPAGAPGEAKEGARASLEIPVPRGRGELTVEPGAPAEKAPEEKPVPPVAANPVNTGGSRPSLDKALQHFYVMRTSQGPRLVYSLRPESDWSRASLGEARQLLTSAPGHGGLDVPGVQADDMPQAPVAPDPNVPPGMELPGVDRPATERASAPEVPVSPEYTILLEGALSPATVKQLRTALDARLSAAGALERWDVRRLLQHRDFRVMVGLQYVLQLARAMGVKSPLKPVLSLTLGSNELTLLEAALIYQAFLQGDIWSFGGEEAETAIIAEIRSPSGALIYSANEIRHPLLEPRIGVGVGRILRGVVEQGTAARSRRALVVGTSRPELEGKLKKAAYGVPFLGKTGTTNEYTNVAFVGFLPAPSQKGKDLPYGRALTVAAYVGYDDNQPMKRGRIRVQGATGALPAWLDAARGVLRDLELHSLLEPAALKPGQEVPLGWPTEMAKVAVDQVTGLRTGTVAVIEGETLAAGSMAWEAFGSVAEGAWREYEQYRPFVRWGEEASWAVASSQPASSSPVPALPVPVETPGSAPLPVEPPSSPPAAVNEPKEDRP